MTPSPDHAPDARRERRVWIRENHPDVGGDASRFTEGLRERDQRATVLHEPGSKPSVHRTHSVGRTLKRLYRRANSIVRRHRRRSRRVR